MTTPAVSPALSPAQAVAAAPEWWYFSRNISRPYRSRISQKAQSGVGDPVPPHAAEVFSAMGLELQPLQELFSRPKPGGEVPWPSVYQRLGGCSIDDMAKWTSLARLTGKVIHLVYESDQMQFYTWSEIAVYYPDGRVEEPKK